MKSLNDIVSSGTKGSEVNKIKLLYYPGDSRNYTNFKELPFLPMDLFFPKEIIEQIKETFFLVATAHIVQSPEIPYDALNMIRGDILLEFFRLLQSLRYCQFKVNAISAICEHVSQNNLIIDELKSFQPLEMLNLEQIMEKNIPYKKKFFSGHMRTDARNFLKLYEKNLSESYITILRGGSRLYCPVVDLPSLLCVYLFYNDRGSTEERLRRETRKKRKKRTVLDKYLEMVENIEKAYLLSVEEKKIHEKEVSLNILFLTQLEDIFKFKRIECLYKYYKIITNEDWISKMFCTPIPEIERRKIFSTLRSYIVEELFDDSFVYLGIKSEYSDFFELVYVRLEELILNIQNYQAFINEEWKGKDGKFDFLNYIGYLKVQFGNVRKSISDVLTAEFQILQYTISLEEVEEVNLKSEINKVIEALYENQYFISFFLESDVNEIKKDYEMKNNFPNWLNDNLINAILEKDRKETC